MTNAEAWFNKSLRPRKPEGSLGRTAQDVHLDSHTAPELWGVWGVDFCICMRIFVGVVGQKVRVVAKLSASTVKREFFLNIFYAISFEYYRANT